MSLSNPTTSQNPASKFITFKEGSWIYWDKQQEKNIVLETPIYFIVLDELFSIKGWNDSLQSGIYSNEVHNTNELLRVKSFKGGLSITGYYNDIKNEVKAEGGRYCKSIYAMMFDKDRNTELVNFQLVGSAFKAFLDSKLKTNSQIISITGENIPAKKGKTDYFLPVFKSVKMDEELKQEAIKMDIELQEYLNSYKSNAVKETTEKAAIVDDEETFNKRNEIVENHEERLNQMADSYEEDEQDQLPF